MQKLKTMCEEKIASRRVEPNSPLWEPLTFVLNQWERLTRFCDVPGVPLDTNLVEQALIMPVRYLAGSFNYQTEDGAVVGDHCHVPHRHGARQRRRARRVVDGVPSQPRGPRQEARALPALGVPRATRGREGVVGTSPRAPPRETPRRGPEPARSAPPARGLRDLAPEVRKGATRRVAAPDQDLQLAGEQR